MLRPLVDRQAEVGVAEDACGVTGPRHVREGDRDLGNGLGFATPAPEMPATAPALVAYWVYQVPIMTMAYLPDMNLLLASGYCW